MTHSKIAQRNFDFPKIVHIHHCPSKNFTFSHQIQVCCSLVCSNERSIASCSTAIIKDSKIAQRNFDFPKVVHIKHCPHKYFTFSRQIQVYCSLVLVCSNERSIHSETLPSFGNRETRWTIARKSRLIGAFRLTSVT